MGKEKNPKDLSNKKTPVSDWFNFDLILSMAACLGNTVATSFVEDSVLRSIITCASILGLICVILTISCRKLYTAGRKENKPFKITAIVLRTILLASVVFCIVYMILCNDLYRDKLLNH